MGWYLDNAGFYLQNLVKLFFIFMLVRAALFLAGFQFTVPYLDPAIEYWWRYIDGKLGLPF